MKQQSKNHCTVARLVKIATMSKRKQVRKCIRAYFSKGLIRDIDTFRQITKDAMQTRNHIWELLEIQQPATNE